MDAELKSWLSFAVQKLDELALLGRSLAAQSAALARRRESTRIYNSAVAKRMAGVQALALTRAPFEQHIVLQRQCLNLPAYPTTTIGSFPQTK